MNKLETAVGGILLCAGVYTATVAADGAVPARGTWSLNNWTPGDGVQLTLNYRKATSRWSWSNTQPIEDLEGLTTKQLRAAHSDVTFTMSRDAGTFSFEGSITLGLGRGGFEFVPDPSFAIKLAALGYKPLDDDPVSILFMAIRDVSLEYAAEVKNSGLKDVELPDLLRLLDHGVDLEFIRALTVAGYANLTADDVVGFRDHGIDSAYLRAMKTSGPSDLSADELIRLHDHGVRPDYVARISSAGYGDLTVDQIIKLHDHGID